MRGSEFCRLHQAERGEDLPGAAEDFQDVVDAKFREAEAEEISDAELRQELVRELDSLVNRVRRATPGYTPPAYSSGRLLELIRKYLTKFSPEQRLAGLEKLRKSLREDLFDPDTWKGVWYMLNYSIDSQRDFFRRRISGEYEIDEWGFDQEILDAVKPFLDFLYYRYWRVQTSGLEKIPEDGRAMLVVNHSGQLPWDAAMLGTAVYNEHPSQRLVRTLYSSWFPTVPFFSALFTKMGQVLGTETNARRLLEQEQLIAAFPEGVKGISKVYRDRYRVSRFGHDSFIRVAVATNTPIIPVSIVGAEEIYISLAKSTTIARLIGVPVFPITVSWPWFGPLGLIPLPTKWYIDIGDPITVDGFDVDAAANLVFVADLTDQLRNQIQDMIYIRLAQRRSVITG
jgi:1-acyl-sn-glycerol-3-phosphate acyltransferase